MVLSEKIFPPSYFTNTYSHFRSMHHFHLSISFPHFKYIVRLFFQIHLLYTFLNFSHLGFSTWGSFLSVRQCHFPGKENASYMYPVVVLYRLHIQHNTIKAICRYLSSLHLFCHPSQSPEAFVPFVSVSWIARTGQDRTGLDSAICLKPVDLKRGGPANYA